MRLCRRAHLVRPEDLAELRARLVRQERASDELVEAIERLVSSHPKLMTHPPLREKVARLKQRQAERQRFRRESDERLECVLARMREFSRPRSI